jgi:DNA polymerase III gamma/tau subunit
MQGIIGQKRVVSLLEHTLKSNRIPQAFIFHGPPGVGKFLTAITLAKTLNCKDLKENFQPCDVCSSCKKISLFQHPDLFFYFPIPK